MTSTAVAPTTPAGALAHPPGYDPYAAYGEQASAVKAYITFKNGEYLFGVDDDVIPLGTRFIANMPGLRVGWKRWSAGRVTDDLLDLLADGVPPRRRSDLGDLDQGLWEIDEKTKQPRDPWLFTNELVFRGQETGDEFVFATSSKGGLGAIGELCKAYGKLYRQKPGMLPVIELGNDHYAHKVYGKTYFPVLRLVDWVRDTASADSTEAPPEPARPVAAPVTAQVPPAAPAKAPEPDKAKRTRF